ncbi:hypothetical protein HYH02_008539 [Chlamydomonas schloesseri]|uniref:CBM20 domain-containing protein n=1 Tax=Chlamydomonas schloesseri TaxID=2026947 RepID=A0A835WFM5_9CHLO|nr:hypothetical protein HYH02_008539 [Chlamydomonas schloesseri]|eukprot:KAG2446552.1 hypothetical protein HYH02_008539 [Chlamydomonas schloesseri]
MAVKSWRGGLRERASPLGSAALPCSIRLHIFSGQGSRSTRQQRNARQVPGQRSSQAVKVLAFQTNLATFDAAPLAKKTAGVRYRFVVPQYVTHYGQELRVVGSLPELGGWNPWTAPRMSWSEGHQWSIETSLPQEAFEFKVIAVEGGHVRWESGSNRVVQTDGECDIPVEVVVWLTCHFNYTGDTGMQLAVPRANVQDAFETGRAQLEMLKKRRSRMSVETEQVNNPVERKRAAAELIRLTEAVVEASTSVHQLGHMLGHAPAASVPGSASGSVSDGEGAAASAATSPAPGAAAKEDENQVLLLAIDSVRLPKAMRRISFASVVQARGEDAASAGAAAVSPFLRGELDARAEELMSAAGALIQEMQQQKQHQQANGHGKPGSAAPGASAEWAELAAEAGHVAEALAHLGAPADTQLQLQGLASVGSALANGKANGMHLPSITSPTEDEPTVPAVEAEDDADDGDETLANWGDEPVAPPAAPAAAKKKKSSPLKQLAANLTGSLPFKLPFNFGTSPPPAVAATVTAAASGSGSNSTSGGGGGGGGVATRHGIFGTLRAGGVALRPAAARSAAPGGGGAMNRQSSVVTAAAAPAAAAGGVAGPAAAPAVHASEAVAETETAPCSGPAAAVEAQPAASQPAQVEQAKGGRKVRTYKGVSRAAKSV